MAEYECVLCTKNEAFVYQIPARTSNRGYRAADWKLDEPDWTGRLRVASKGNSLIIKLEDSNTGELFAQCPVDAYPSAAVEQVLDSSRYFVMRIQDGSGRCAFIGLGFSDRGDSFDLLVTIQDHFKRVNRDVKTEAEQIESEDAVHHQSSTEPEPKLDLAFKEGQTIKINITTKKSSGESSCASRSRAKGTGGGASPFLPPPPSPSRHSASHVEADTKCESGVSRVSLGGVKPKPSSDGDWVSFE